MEEKFDHVVIGAGIVGSCTAWQLATRGKKALLLEQFYLPHTRGSSHGQSRLLRTMYKEPYYASMMVDAYALWKKIEETSNTTLIQNTKALGLVPDKDTFAALKQNMEKYSPENMQLVDLKKLDPEFMKFSDGYEGILDLTGSVVLADKALIALQGLFKKLGGEIRDGNQVTSVENVGDDVKITTSKGVIVACSLVVCAGPWTSKLFNEKVNQLLNRVTKPLAVRVYYWKIVKNIDGKIPSFLDFSESFSVLGLVSDEYPGLMKVLYHGGVSSDPDERDKTKFDSTIEDKLKQYIKDHLPMLEPKPAIIESCMYTMSKDEDFIIDSVPTYKNVYIGCGFSGTGFKTAPIVGKLLSELALGLKPSRDLNRFALKRFN